MEDEVKYIRDGDLVLIRNSDTGRFVFFEKYKTVNAAKKFTRVQTFGTVRRKESIIKEHGEKFYQELLQ
jgi:hypothetical protein